MLILILWISGVLSLHNPQNDNIFDLLDSIRNKIIHSEEKLELKGHVTKFPRKEPHSVHQHYENYHHFVQNTWRSFTHDLPVIVIGCALNYNRLGNRIGSLLTDIACAGMSGAHIILIDTANRTITQPNDVFFDSIPHVVVHPNPAQNRSMVLTKYLKICADGRFPWHTPFPREFVEPSSKLFAHFRSFLTPAIDNTITASGIGTTIKSTLLPLMESIDKPDLGTDVNLINKDLPLYPDVVVHYRCSDNIALRGRGLTQFHTILNAIPSTAQYVMILTEGGDLSSLIVEELRRRIMAKFPSILQVISRSGGNILGSTFTIVKAKTLICSVSSFCLYFGALNSEGNVYMPTRLYYGHHINLDNFHTLENNAAVTFWKNPNGSRIEIPLFHYSLDDPAYDSKLQVTIKQMIAVLQNETYTHVTDQIHCKIKNIAKPGETALNTCT